MIRAQLKIKKDKKMKEKSVNSAASLNKNFKLKNCDYYTSCVCALLQKNLFDCFCYRSSFGRFHDDTLTVREPCCSTTSVLRNRGITAIIIFLVPTYLELIVHFLYFCQVYNIKKDKQRSLKQSILKI